MSAIDGGAVARAIFVSDRVGTEREMIAAGTPEVTSVGPVGMPGGPSMLLDSDELRCKTGNSGCAHVVEYLRTCATGCRERSVRLCKTDGA